MIDNRTMIAGQQPTGKEAPTLESLSANLKLLIVVIKMRHNQLTKQKKTITVAKCGHEYIIIYKQSLIDIKLKVNMSREFSSGCKHGLDLCFSQKDYCSPNGSVHHQEFPKIFVFTTDTGD